MKGRESGMPEEDYWNTFFDPTEIIKSLVPVSNLNGDLVEFGAGYGTFTIPASTFFRGQTHAIDIDKSALNVLISNLDESSSRRIRVIERDFVEIGTGLENESCTHVMLYNILHIENPELLAKEAYRILKTGMSVSVIHWRSDIETPRGPNIEIRPKQEDCKRIMESVGFTQIQNVLLNQAAPYHFGMTFQKGEE